MNSIFKRRSYRKFLDKEVESDKIEKLLRAGMQAPSACDQRPWEFLVISDKNKLQELSLATPFSMCVKNSRVAIVPCYRKDNLKALDYVICDMSACCENILIEAQELGLGAVWIGISPVKDREEKLTSILQIKDNIIPFCIIPIGYPVDYKDFEDRFDKERIHFIK